MADDRSKSWWVQAETIVSSLRMYERTKDPKYLSVFETTVAFIESKLVDWEVGEWYESLSAQGQPQGDKASPITKGIADFTQDDELYSKLQGDAPIHVLVQADSDWSKKTEPLAFTLSYGSGRVFHHTFGHDPKALSTPEVKALIVQGTTWAAGR